MIYLPHQLRVQLQWGVALEVDIYLRLCVYCTIKLLTLAYTLWLGVYNVARHLFAKKILGEKHLILCFGNN